MTILFSKPCFLEAVVIKYGNIDKAISLKAIIDINTSDVVRVSYGDETETTDYDLKFVPHNSNMYNIAWDIYEIAVTSLPLERVHPEGECDKDMLTRFSAEMPIDELDA